MKKIVTQLDGALPQYPLVELLGIPHEASLAGSTKKITAIAPLLTVSVSPVFCDHTAPKPRP